MMKRNVDRDEMVKLLGEIRASFPHLRMDLQLQHPHVDLNMDIPSQPGLPFDVNLNLQGDELHLTAGSLWFEWFPCTDPAIVALYSDATAGLLSGEYRILEHCIASRPVKAQLQRPQGDAWLTIGTWSNLGIVIPWRRTTRVLQTEILCR